MGSPCRPGVGRELHRQDELLAWHRLELRPRRPTHHDNVPHPEHPRDPQRHRQHLLPPPSLPQQPQASTPFPPSSLSFPPAPHSAQSLPSPTSYSDCSTPSSATSASPLNSPTGQSSVQHIQSQFIKEGLKMKVRQKLKSEPEEGGAYETNIKIKKEAEDLTWRTKSEDDDDASGTR